MLLAGCGSNGSEQPPTLSDDSLYATFRDPGNEWRGKPFWSWNGRLEKDELIRQLHVFKEMGMGGAFLHSRVGLKTEYLGPEWFDLTNAVVDEAARLGMEAYLYDEDRWPSGSAGGMVTVDTSLRMKYLILETMPAEQFEWNDEGIVSAFACDLNGIDYSNLQRLNPASNMADYAGKTVLKFAQRTCPESDVYNGTTYLDVFNPKATERFIELTHEQYRKHCGERIGTTIEGIFTDEPHRGGLFSTFGAVSTYACPWALSLPQEYEKMFGGDLTADLPKLFLRENGERVNDVKWKFCELTQSLFLKNFAKPQYDWCTEHDMAYTGHVLHENNLTSQVTMQGSLMRYYEYMHTPGIDLLTENDNAYWVPKQLSSVARQLGQKWLLSEMYGCTGWQFDFENHKAVGDWQALFGINLRCQHLSWYTMEGEAKRDYPASIFFQSPWWKQYKYVEDYFSRLGVMLNQGAPVCDVLVVNPIESVWSQVCVRSFNGLSPAAPEIAEMEDTLKSPRKVDTIIVNQLRAIAKEYGAPRKTEVLYEVEQMEEEPVEEVPDYPVRVFFTREGYFKKITPQSLRMSGEQKLKEGDAITQEMDTTNAAELMFFTNLGQVYKSRVAEFDDTKASVMGDYVASKLGMDTGEVPVYMALFTKYEGYMLFIFENGKAAKVDMASYETKTRRKKLTGAFSTKSPLVYAAYLPQDTELLLRSSASRMLIFHTAMILSKAARDTQGVQVMTLSKSTIETHIKHIYAKTDVHSKQELIDLIESYQEGTGEAAPVSAS